MIVVTGASGNLGSVIVKHLLQIVAPSELAVSVRDPSGIRDLTDRGIEVRHGDFDRPETLDHAFAAADRLFIISAGGIDYEQRVRQHRHAIEAAKRAKVKHVYYTSLVHGRQSVAYVMKAHIETEQLLKDSGLSFTILQNGIYAEAVDIYLGDYSQGEVIIPADGPVAWVSRDDLAAGIARLLRDGGHHGETLRLTGPATLTIRNMAEVLADFTDRSIEVRIVPLEEYVRHQTSAGKAEEHTRQWASTYLAMARGEFAVVDPLLHELLGRPLQTVEAVLRHVTAKPSEHPRERASWVNG